MKFDKDKQDEFLDRVYADEILRFGIPEKGQIEDFARAVGVTPEQYKYALLERLRVLRTGQPITNLTVQ